MKTCFSTNNWVSAFFKFKFFNFSKITNLNNFYVFLCFLFNVLLLVRINSPDKNKFILKFKKKNRIWVTNCMTFLYEFNKNFKITLFSTRKWKKTSIKLGRCSNLFPLVLVCIETVPKKRHWLLKYNNA